MLSDSEKLNAIVWRAKEKGISYGVFSATISEKEKLEIYKEYEKILTAQQEAEDNRLKKWKKTKKKSK